jgi:cation:H+ antiporter
MAGDLVLMAASFAIILSGAVVFTNAVEWAGRRLDLGEGAVGSLLAAVGTAMPETLIPIVAVIGAEPGSDGVAIGAIIGAPFLLATIAMVVVGLSALGYRGRRSQGRHLEAHAPTLDRDLGFFLVFFAIGAAVGLGVPEGVRVGLAVVFVAAYGAYVRATLRRGGEVEAAESIRPLILGRHTGREPAGRAIVLQFVVGLGAMVGGAHLFVDEAINLAESIGVAPIVLSLVLAPLATELPEKANSFFWVREGKDALALGNITGAMAFQATIPVAFGLAFTAWDLDRYAMLSAVLGIAGGIVAYWALRLQGRFSVPAILSWAALYAVFLVYVALS